MTVRTRRTRGYTMIDQMVVLSIAAGTAGAGFPVFQSVLEHARVIRTGWDLKVVSQALQRARIDFGDFPRGVDQEKGYGQDPGLVDSPFGGTRAYWGPYLASWPTKSAWGTPGPIEGNGVYGYENENTMAGARESVPGGFVDHNERPRDSAYVLFDGADGRATPGAAAMLDDELDDGKADTGHIRRERSLYGEPRGSDDGNVLHWYVGEGPP